jgi:lipoate-protein ligase A
MALHGAYQLVSVDLSVQGARLAEVRVHAESLIQPASAARPTLDAIAAILNGAPVELGTAALSARIRSAIPFGVELVGANPDDVARAVRRAVIPGGHAGDSDSPEGERDDFIGSFTTSEIEALTAGWRGLSWHVIPERPFPPALNVALDEVLLDQLARGERPATLRFWRWTQPAVAIGRCQSVANEVDLHAAEEAGVQVVRRMTGGGAMFLQPHGAVTYSLLLPESALAGLTIRQSYEVCDGWVIRALRALGIDAHHVPINDIACSDGKIGGAAQARRRGVVVHHATLAHAMDASALARVLRIGRDRSASPATPSASKRVSPLIRQTARARELIVQHLLEGFVSTYGGREAAIEDRTLSKAQQLVAEKYGHPKWTHEIA